MELPRHVVASIWIDTSYFAEASRCTASRTDCRHKIATANCCSPMRAILMQNLTASCRDMRQLHRTHRNKTSRRGGSFANGLELFEAVRDFHLRDRSNHDLLQCR